MQSTGVLPPPLNATHHIDMLVHPVHRATSRPSAGRGARARAGVTSRVQTARRARTRRTIVPRTSDPRTARACTTVYAYPRVPVARRPWILRVLLPDWVPTSTTTIVVLYCVQLFWRGSEVPCTCYVICGAPSTAALVAYYVSPRSRNFPMNNSMH